MSPGTCTATETTNVSSSIFELAIDRYGFYNLVRADNSGNDVDVHGQKHSDDDEEDEEDKENALHLQRTLTMTTTKLDV